jgi:hypothetical protein
MLGMKNLLRSFWGRLAIVLVLSLVVYVFAILLPHIQAQAKQQIPQKALVQFRATVDQAYLSYQTLALHSETGRTTYLTMSNASSNAQSSLESLKSALSHPPKQVSTRLADQLKTVARQESAALSAYSGRYTALLKPLSYFPEEDLTISTEGASRAQAAAEALKTLAVSPALQLKSPAAALSQPIITSSTDTFQLSQKTRRTLQASAQCFTTFAQQVQHNSSEAKTTLNTCNKTYESTTRPQVAQDVLAPLRDSGGKDIQSRFAEALGRLDKRL